MKIKRARGYRTAGHLGSDIWTLIRKGHREHTAAEWVSLLGIQRREFFRAVKLLPWLQLGLIYTPLHKKGIRIERFLDAFFRVPPSRAYHLCPSKDIRRASRIEKIGSFDRQNPHLAMQNSQNHRCRHWLGRLKRLLWRWGATPIFRDWGVSLEKCIGMIVWKWKWGEKRLLALERGLWQLISGPYANSTPRGLCRNRASIKARWGYAFLCLKKIEAIGQCA